jgi:hypothetical protein
MAACDNLYGDYDQWQELYDFLSQNKPEYLVCMNPKPDIDYEGRICYIPRIQGWLYENCKIDWVLRELESNFSVQTMICGKPHHKRVDNDNI